MKRDFVPQCIERGYEKHILDDEHPGMRNALLFDYKKIMIDN